MNGVQYQSLTHFGIASRRGDAPFGGSHAQPGFTPEGGVHPPGDGMRSVDASSPCDCRPTPSILGRAFASVKRVSGPVTNDRRSRSGLPTRAVSLPTRNVVRGSRRLPVVENECDDVEVSGLILAATHRKRFRVPEQSDVFKRLVDRVFGVVSSRIRERLAEDDGDVVEGARKRGRVSANHRLTRRARAMALGDSRSADRPVIARVGGGSGTTKVRIMGRRLPLLDLRSWRYVRGSRG
jgi:hypothetical protein